MSNVQYEDSKKWITIYENDINKRGNVSKYVKYKLRNKRALINLIKKYSYNKKILEAGSGTAILSTYLANIGFDSMAIDIDADMLELAKRISQEYGGENKPKFTKQSIFELDYNKNYFDVTFSNGVLEHFSDEQIVDTLKQQMNISTTVIFGIPTKYFNQAEAKFGDERYLDFSYWRHLIDKADGKIIQEKSCHYLGFWKRLFDIKKYFKPKAYRIFVVNKKSIS